MRLLYLIFMIGGVAALFPPSVELSFSRSDFVAKRWESVTLVENFTRPTAVIADEICKTLASQLDDGRCLTNAASTIHSMRVDVAESTHNNYLQHHSNFPVEETSVGILLSLTTAYQPSERTSIEKKCVVGPFSMRKAILILLASPFFELVWYFSRPTAAEQEYVRVMQKFVLEHGINGRLLLLPESNIDSAPHNCHSLHVIDKASQSLPIFPSAAAEHLRSVLSTFVRNQKELQIIWECYLPVHDKHSSHWQLPLFRNEKYYNLINWSIHTSWHTPAKLVFVPDSQSFWGRSLSSDDVDGDALTPAPYHDKLVELSLGTLSFDHPRNDVPPSSDHRGIVLIITYTCRLFSETARGVQQGLVALGYTHTHIECDLSVDYLDTLRSFYTTNTKQPVFLQLAIAPHEPTFLLPNYIAIQMEQMWSPFFHSHHPRYHKVLSEAVGIWTFSSKLTNDMIELGFSAGICHSIPMLTDGKLSLQHVHQRLLEEEEVGTSYYEQDVYIFGSGSKRRVSFLEDFVWQNQKAGEPLVVGGAVGGFSEMVLDDHRDHMVSHSLVIMNIHTESTSSLEVHRINYLLSMGKCVVSERSQTDPDLDDVYAEVVVFVNDPHDVYEVVRWLVEDEETRKSIEQRAFQFYHNTIAKDLLPLQSAMANAVSIIS